MILEIAVDQKQVSNEKRCLLFGKQLEELASLAGFEVSDKELFQKQIG